MADVLKPVDIRSFRDREKGRPAWVLGCGPSLLDEEPEDMREGCMIAANHSIWATERLGLPMIEYWLFGDIALPIEINARNYPAASKWTCCRAAAYLLGQGLKTSDHGTGDCFVCFGLGGSAKIKLDVPDLNPRRSTVQAAIHLAWMLGCDPIHVRGVDFKAGPEERRHWYGLPGEATGEEPAVYEQQRETMHAMISAVKASGRTVTVRGAKELEGHYTPWYTKPEPLVSAAEAEATRERIMSNASK